ncbi:fructosamine kinase family protein [Rhizomonospora bruguierae]|uniref:fructosamine kinase family protein n=1 Tax=Rhizomonospora bruguierae TaxID=1581705 RepID=UPI001BD1A3A0|nr:fructosamine kinase family protein [Micromonospora sp. NBRC 107566]
MDLAYLRAHPRHLTAFRTHQRIRETPVPGGSICTAVRLTLDDGASLFAKGWPEGAPPKPEGFFEAEANGLRWLRAADAAPVPEVVAELADGLAMEWVEPGPPTSAAAERLGRELAALHRAGADAFGASWPGYIGSLPLDNTPSRGPWPVWFAERRLAPYLRRSADNHALTGDDVALVERIIDQIEGYGGAEPPARVHGDLWPGNVLWAAPGEPGGAGRGWLVDPAAHGGHRETDLATLALWGGVPHLDRLLAGYQEVWPLAGGWWQRVPLHQLHLLLVHTALFGGAYREAVVAAASRLLSV